MAETPKDQKTEEATPRRLEKAREEGQVAQSSELTAVMMMMAGAIGLIFGGGALLQRGAQGFINTMQQLPSLGTEEISLPDWAVLVAATLRAPVPVIMMLLAPPLIMGLLVAYSQVGLKLAPKAITPKLEKLDPIKGVSRIFSIKAVVRTLFAVLKITLTIAAMTGVAITQVEEVSLLAGDELGPVLVGVGRVVLISAAAGLAVLLVLSILDFLFQRWQHLQDMRMTKQEVKDENKTTEGDPHVRARIRRVQRELASRRMMEEVPKATVIVTNPTHFAVALKYDTVLPSGAGQAPRVVAKGVDDVAMKIREIASENDVPRVEDRPLARALYARVRIGEEIPEELFQAVAGVLAYVYRLEEQKRQRQTVGV